jgi:NADH:ubiquinone reductase (non-electrogenic)
MRQIIISKSNNKSPPSTTPSTQSDLFSAIVDGVGDSATDIGRHLSRLVSKARTSSSLDTILSKKKDKVTPQAGSKPVVLILGSGWVGHSLVKVIDTDSFDVVLVSPRNFFMFTPMLPSTAVGTVEFRSLLEPIRTSNEFVSYLEATCESVDLHEKV